MIDAYDGDQNVLKLILMSYNNSPGCIQAGARWYLLGDQLYSADEEGKEEEEDRPLYGQIRGNERVANLWVEQWTWEGMEQVG
jgi:hypothetical protein